MPPINGLNLPSYNTGVQDFSPISSVYSSSGGTDTFSASSQVAPLPLPLPLPGTNTTQVAPPQPIGYTPPPGNGTPVTNQTSPDGSPLPLGSGIGGGPLPLPPDTPGSGGPLPLPPDTPGSGGPLPLPGGSGGTRDLIDRLGLNNIQDGAYVNSIGDRFYRLVNGKVLKISSTGVRTVINNDNDMTSSPAGNSEEDRYMYALAIGVARLGLRPRAAGSNVYVNDRGIEHVLLAAANGNQPRAVIYRPATATDGVITPGEVIEFNTAEANLGEQLAGPVAGVTIPSSQQLEIIKSENLRPRLPSDVVAGATGGTARAYGSGQWVQQRGTNSVPGIFTLGASNRISYSGGSVGAGTYIAPPCYIERRTLEGSMQSVWYAEIGGAGNPTGPGAGPHRVQVGVPPRTDGSASTRRPEFYIRIGTTTYIYNPTPAPGRWGTLPVGS